jgi:biotin carboxyl carrier protein
VAGRRACRKPARPLRRCLLAKYFLRLGDREIEAELEETPEGLRVNIDGEWYTASLQRIGESSRYVLVLQDRLLEVLVEEDAQGFNISMGGRSYEIETTRRRRTGRQEQADSFVEGRWTLIAPLTGVVTELHAAPGQPVDQGEILIVIEAMKMLNDLRSRVQGIVSEVYVGEKERVEIGQRLVEIRERQ